VWNQERCFSLEVSKVQEHKLKVEEKGTGHKAVGHSTLNLGTGFQLGWVFLLDFIKI